MKKLLVLLVILLGYLVSDILDQTLKHAEMTRKSDLRVEQEFIESENKLECMENELNIKIDNTIVVNKNVLRFLGDYIHEKCEINLLPMIISSKCYIIARDTENTCIRI